MDTVKRQAAAECRPVRRIVTGHDTHGRSVILFDGPTPNIVQPQHVPTVAQVVWTTETPPARFEHGEDPAPAGRVFSMGPTHPGSTILRIVDFPADDTVNYEAAQAMLDKIGGPGVRDRNQPRHFFFHKTESLDYAIVLEGEIFAMLDVGETLMRPGDVLIQRATNHSWSNRSGRNCRMAFVLIEAARGMHEPAISINGT